MMQKPDGNDGKPPHNPFSRRTNFPDFEEAIAVDTSNESHSFCSQSSASLNLSIGARAALHEHLRHVAKYGFDHDEVEEEEQGGSQTGQRQEEQELADADETASHDPRDMLWDKLLVDTAANSIPGESNASFVSPVAPDTVRCFEKVVAVAPDEFEILSVEQNTSDYFDSSRVEQLQTPDRNRTATIRGVTSRQADESFSSGTGNTSFALPVSMNEVFERAKMEKSFENNLDTLSRVDDSFTFPAVEWSGISAVDLSRISVEGSDAGLANRSPDASFATHDHRTTIDDISVRDTFSTPRRRPAHRSEGLKLRSSPPRRNLPSIPRKTPPRDAENVPNFADPLSLSPIRTHGSVVAAPVDRPGETIPSSKLLFAGSQQQRSQGGGQDERLGRIVLEVSNDQSDEVSTLQNSSSDNRNSSSTSHSSAGLTLDRRLYRTVVPSRVFMDAGSDFPEQYDSFSAPPPRRKRHDQHGGASTSRHTR